MNFALSDEQLFLQEAAARALGRHDTHEAARAALDGAPPLSLWSTAVEAGWTGLLSGDDAGGAELGALDAMLVLESCGRALGDAHLLGHLPACWLLEVAEAPAELREALAAGDKRAVFADDLDAVVDAAGADVLVANRDGEAVLVAERFEAEPLRSYDGARTLARVKFDGGTHLGVSVDDARHLQRALLGAEQLGAATACLALARGHALDRMAFGRPIGSYQAIKHKLVEMLRLIENARSLTYYAGWAWEHRREEFALAANAVGVAAGDALDYAAPECIFIHGGVGATWEHDASLYYRRAEMSRRLLGGIDRAADALAAELLA